MARRDRGVVGCFVMFTVVVGVAHSPRVRRSRVRAIDMRYASRRVGDWCGWWDEPPSHATCVRNTHALAHSHIHAHTHMINSIDLSMCALHARAYNICAFCCARQRHIGMSVLRYERSNCTYALETSEFACALPEITPHALTGRILSGICVCVLAPTFFYTIRVFVEIKVRREFIYAPNSSFIV